MILGRGGGDIVWRRVGSGDGGRYVCDVLYTRDSVLSIGDQELCA